MSRIKTRDLTPKAFSVRSAEQELSSQYVSGESPMAQNMGGLQMFSNSFKRGHGNAVFGADENGIWLGAADYAGAPFRVGLDGTVQINNGDNSSQYDADSLVFYEDGVPVIIIGDPANV